MDSLTYAKLNVLHWHFSDSQSMSLASVRFPSLTERGAYHPRQAVYAPHDVDFIIASAHNRGIRVVPEVDVPGHTASWGNGFGTERESGGVTVHCPEYVGGDRAGFEHGLDGVALRYFEGEGAAGAAGEEGEEGGEGGEGGGGEVEGGGGGSRGMDALSLTMGLLEEVFERFPDPFIHLGGDEVDGQCWSEDHALVAAAVDLTEGSGG